MRVIKLVADRQRERRGTSASERPERLARRGPLDRREGLGAASLLVAWFFGLGVAVRHVLRDPDADLDRPARRRLDRRVQGAPASLTNASTSAWRAQPDDGERARARRVAAPPREVHPHRVRDQRVPAADRVAQRLAVAVPQLLVAAQRRTVRRIRRGNQTWIGRSIHTTTSACSNTRSPILPAVAAVDHPALAGEHRLEDAAQLVVGRLGPVRAVHERIELDVRDAEPLARARGRPSSCRCHSPRR